MADGRESNLWAAGAILFAGIMMIVVGIWEALEGLIAIFENEFYVATRRYLFQFDVTAWGWIHVILGLVLAFAGYGLLAGGPGRGWSRSPWLRSVLSPTSCGFRTTRFGRCSSSRWTCL
jgi:hypothetical protein